MLAIILVLLMAGQCFGTPPVPPPRGSDLSAQEAREILDRHGLAEGPLVVFGGYGLWTTAKGIGDVGGLGEMRPIEPSLTLKGGRILPISQADKDSLYEMDGGYFARVLLDENGEVSRSAFLLINKTIKGWLLGGWNLSYLVSKSPIALDSLEDALQNPSPGTIVGRVGLRKDGVVSSFEFPILHSYLDGGHIAFIAWRGEGSSLEIHPQPAGLACLSLDSIQVERGEAR